MQPSTASGLSSAHFKEAQQLFLLQNPQPMTDSAWKKYVANRRGAAKFLPKVKGMDGIAARTEVEGTGGYEDPSLSGSFEEICMIDAIKRELEELEGELKLKKDLLLSNFKLLSCEGEFDENTEKVYVQPREIATHVRFYSPTRPAYVDLHLSYRAIAGYNDFTWNYTLGLKVHNRPAENDYDISKTIKKFDRKPFNSWYGIDGWRPFAYGYYGEGSTKYGDYEHYGFQLSNDDVLDVYEALWGPPEDLPEQPSAEDTLKRRRDLVNTIRIILGALGIEYHISCEDGVEDERGDRGERWMLEGLSNRWFARGARKACGFELKEDPAMERKGKEDQVKELNYGREDEEDDDEEEFLDD